MVGTVVLAGERDGVSPFAAAFDAPAKVLVPVAGKPSLIRVIAALRASASSAGGVVCGPAEVIAGSDPTCADIFAHGDFRWLKPAPGPASSALAGVDALGGGASGQVLVTSGDHAMLRAETIDAFCAAAARSDADFVVGVAAYDAVQNAFPGSKRTVWRFADAQLCGCNLFFVRTTRGRAVLTFWQSVETLRKQPWKIAGRLGWLTLWRYFRRHLTAAAAFDVLSSRCGCRVDFVGIDDPRAAVDVDSMADWRLAEDLLGRDQERSDGDAGTQQPA